MGKDQAQKPAETLSILMSILIILPIGFEVTVICEIFVEPDCTTLIMAFDGAATFSIGITFIESDFASNCAVCLPIGAFRLVSVDSLA